MNESKLNIMDLAGKRCLLSIARSSDSYFVLEVSRSSGMVRIQKDTPGRGPFWESATLINVLDVLPDPKKSVLVMNDSDTSAMLFNDVADYPYGIWKLQEESSKAFEVWHSMVERNEMKGDVHEKARLESDRTLGLLQRAEREFAVLTGQKPTPKPTDKLTPQGYATATYTDTSI